MMLGWLFGSKDGEVDDGTMKIVEACGQILAHGSARDNDSNETRGDKIRGVVVHSDEDVERLRTKWRDEAIHRTESPINAEPRRGFWDRLFGASDDTPNNGTPREGASAEEIFSGWQQ